MMHLFDTMKPAVDEELPADEDYLVAEEFQEDRAAAADEFLQKIEEQRQIVIQE